MRYEEDADTNSNLSCGATDDGWSCTLLKKHQGQHIATSHFGEDPSHVMGYVYARWAQEGQKTLIAPIKTTVAARVLETLRIADEPLTQPQIADRCGDNPASVRRTVQELRSALRIVVQDYAGFQQSPRFLLPA